MQMLFLASPRAFISRQTLGRITRSNTIGKHGRGEAKPVCANGESAAPSRGGGGGDGSFSGLGLDADPPVPSKGQGGTHVNSSHRQ